MPTDKPRFTITVDPELLQQIEDFRYTHRIKNQTQAVISLMELGLQEIIKNIPVQQASAPNPYAADEVQIIEDYRAFNDEGKEKIRDYVADLKCNAKYKKCTKPIMDKEA